MNRDNEKTCRCEHCSCELSTEGAKDESVWVDTAELPSYPKLSGAVEAEVAIVGAGITGLTAALALAKAGKKVVVLEAATIGSGVTGYTTAHLTALIDMRYQDIAKEHGKEAARQVAAASQAAIQHVEEVSRELNINCDFQYVPGYLYTEREEERAMLQQEAAAAKEAGLKVNYVKTTPLPFPVAGAVEFIHQAEFHPLKYLAGVAQALQVMGVKIYENTRVEEVSKDTPPRLKTSGGVVTADHVFLATHSPITKMMSVQSKIAAYRSYVVGIKTKKPLPHALYWDTEDPYHYTRVQTTSDGEIIIIGGEDHKTGQASNAQTYYQKLEDYVTDHFSAMSLKYRWSAQVFNSCDGLPFIGQAPFKKNIYVATGYSGNGMTFGTIGGLLVSDLILQKENAWATLFRPNRISLRSLFTTYLKENMNVGRQYLKSYLNRGAKTAVADIPRTEGRVVNLNGKKLAVYKDAAGNLTKLSPVCTHAGCTVEWNNAEKSWDCPCHGSRFAPDGTVTVGPALKNLAPHAD